MSGLWNRTTALGGTRLASLLTTPLVAAAVLAGAPTGGLSEGLDVLCVYYPEWHVYPEGEAIFGKGRTEWDLVRTATPRFPGHCQPVGLVDGEPDDSDPQAVAREIDLAADAGIDVFLYDWYWADGHPIQHEALERGFLRAPNRRRVKFALMWANHDRSNAFRPEIGKAGEKYFWKLKWTSEEFLGAIDYCIKTYFDSPDYYQKDGKVFFSVYSANRLISRVGGPAKMKATLEEAQARMRRAGLPPIHFSAMIHYVGDAAAATAAGYDSVSAYNVTPYDFDDNDVGKKVNAGVKQVLTHEEFADAHRQFNARMQAESERPFIPVVTRGWDCTPRCRQDEPFPWRTQSLTYPYLGVVSGLSPHVFGAILSAAKRQAENDPKKPGAILINAWNEYTEGCYLMPDRWHGDAFLGEVKKTFRTAAPTPVQSFARSADVTVDDGFWAPRFELWRTVTIPDIFAKYEQRSGALRNFDRAAAGRREGHEGLDFYDGNVLEAVRGASDYLARYPSEELDARLDGIIERIAAAQLPDGYLHTGVQIKAPAQRWGDNGGCALSQHEIYNAGCLIEAGVHHYRATRKTKLLACGIRFANLLCETMGPPPRRNLIPTHSLPEEALMELVRLVREDPAAGKADGAVARPEDYASLVGFWLESHGRNCGSPDWEKIGLLRACAAVREMTRTAHGPEWRPCWGDYQMDRKPLDEYVAIEGHAVRATLLGSGLAAHAVETGDGRSARLAKRFWESMVGRKMYVTGGVGSNPKPELNLENFGDDYSLPPDAYLETCAAIGSAFFSANLAALTGDGRYMDEFERVAYNALLAEVSADGTHYTYCNPLNTDKGERFDWHGVPCCPAMFLKLTGALPGYAYAKGRSGYYVNLFIGGRTAFADAQAGRVAFVQKTRYPEEGRIEISVRPERPAAFPVRVRIPGWARGQENPFGLYASDHSGKWSVSVNGTPVTSEVVSGYLVMERTWKSGDVICVDLDVSQRNIRACSAVKELRGKVAVARGPVVYAEERGKLIPFHEVVNGGPCPHRVWTDGTPLLGKGLSSK